MSATVDTHAPATLASEYFDGQTATARPVTLHIEPGSGDLLIEGEGVARRVPRHEQRWPERQRHGPRLMYLRPHGLISHADGAAWDAWARAHGVRDPLVVRWMQSWRGVAWALVVCVLLAWAGWQWGVPGAGRVIVAAIPPAVDAAIGEQALQSFDREGLAPSRLPPARQAAIRRRFQEAVDRAYPADQRPAHVLHFRSSGRLKIGPNALALPGGQMVLTDELAELLADAPDVVTGVLAHELGHVRHRHGMRMVVQASLLAAAAGLVVGDFSSVLATVPAVLGQAAYSRDAEREADLEAIAVLRANGLRPSRMELLFERLAQARGRRAEGKGGATGEDAADELPIAMASHPADAERRRTFREADGARR
ncbi:M48 family metallopeptidase [Ideonella sp.]|uniref:M48 family metallopeptidase n=1 Tax=Ideonella sp. TaxID=1929293 RepID=UPI0035B0AB49